MPPLRKRNLLDVRTHAGTTVAQTAARLQLPWSTADRAMQELHLLGAVEAQKDTDSKGWRYTCADVLDQTALNLMVDPENYEKPSPEKSVVPQPPKREDEKSPDPAPQSHPLTDIPADDPQAAVAGVVQHDDDVIDVYDDPGQEKYYRMLDDLHEIDPAVDGRGEAIRATAVRLDGPAVCPDCGTPHGLAADVQCTKCYRLAGGGL